MNILKKKNKKYKKRKTIIISIRIKIIFTENDYYSIKVMAINKKLK